MTSLKPPHSLDEPLDPLTFTVDKPVVDRIRARLVDQVETKNAHSHAKPELKEAVLSELCSVALTELETLHLVPHSHGTGSGQTESTQAAMLRHEIGDILASVVDGSIELEMLPVETLHRLIGAHRQSVAMLKACSGSTEELAKIAAFLRQVHAAANVF